MFEQSTIHGDKAGTHAIEALERALSERYGQEDIVVESVVTKMDSTDHNDHPIILVSAVFKFRTKAEQERQDKAMDATLDKIFREEKEKQSKLKLVENESEKPE